MIVVSAFTDDGLIGQNVHFETGDDFLNLRLLIGCFFVFHVAYTLFPIGSGMDSYIKESVEPFVHLGRGSRKAAHK